jgi:hypothetical protein
VGSILLGRPVFVVLEKVVDIVVASGTRKKCNQPAYIAAHSHFVFSTVDLYLAYLFIVLFSLQWRGPATKGQYWNISKVGVIHIQVLFDFFVWHVILVVEVAFFVSVNSK